MPLPNTPKIVKTPTKPNNNNNNHSSLNNACDSLNASAVSFTPSTNQLSNITSIKQPRSEPSKYGSSPSGGFASALSHHTDNSNQINDNDELKQPQAFKQPPPFNQQQLNPSSAQIQPVTWDIPLSNAANDNQKIQNTNRQPMNVSDSQNVAIMSFASSTHQYANDINRQII